MRCRCAPCGGKSSDNIVFCTYGDKSELAIYTAMVDEFNKTYGAQHNIKVEHTPISPVTDTYNNYIQNTYTARNGFDVFLVIEDRFKAWANAGIMCDMTEYFNAVTDIDTSDVFENTVNRLRLNVSNNTSNPTDPLYGLPLDTKPSALYYNETMFKKAGIDISAWTKRTWTRGMRVKLPTSADIIKEIFRSLRMLPCPRKGITGVSARI